MKAIYPIIILCLFLSVGNTNAQDADIRIAELLNKGEWFQLEREYPMLKDDIQVTVLKGLSEALICFHFNQPEEAIQKIDSLLTNHQAELGFDNLSEMVLIKSMIAGNQGRYGEAVDILEKFLNQITDFAEKKDFPKHLAHLYKYNVFPKIPESFIIRPESDIEIPIYIEEAGRGVHMFIPVTIQNKEYRFIFDTGAEYTLLSERMVNELNLTITHDSIDMTGVRKTVAKATYIDQLFIGDIVFNHVPVFVIPQNEETDSVYQVDAVLGIDFIKKVQEVQIYPDSRTIRFPHIQTFPPASGRNLMLRGNILPCINLQSDNNDLFFIFDTGNVKTTLTKAYYDRNQQQTEIVGIKDTMRSGGIGGLVYSETFRLPRFPLKVGDSEIVLENIHVVTDNSEASESGEDGNLGMDFITSFKKVIINLDKMFVAGEK